MNNVLTASPYIQLSAPCKQGAPLRAGGRQSSSTASRLDKRPLDMFPAGLLTGEYQAAILGDEAPGWWLGHTRPRQEKIIAFELAKQRVGYYLPLLSRNSLSRGRMRTAYLPLFPGYVFLFGSEEERLRALKTNRLVTLQYVPDGEQLRQQLAPVAAAIAAGIPLVRESRLMPGERVRVKAGLLRDVEGIVLRRNGKTELLIAVDFLQQGAALEIDDCLLEPM